jgi:hypothetical protein
MIHSNMIFIKSYIQLIKTCSSMTTISAVVVLKVKNTNLYIAPPCWLHRKEGATTM